MRSVSSYLSLMDAAPERIREAFVRRRFRPGEYVLEPSMENRSLYFLLEGKAEVALEDPEGRTLTLYQYGPDSMFGELEIFCGSATKGIRALTACELVKLDRELVYEWMGADFDFTLRLCSDMAGKLLDLTRTTQRLNMLPLNVRVLDRLYTEHLTGGLVGLSKQALADRVGAPLRSVNRVLRAWLEQGLVEYRAGQFRIPDPERVSVLLRRTLTED